jgi:hypothetical protein
LVKKQFFVKSRLWACWANVHWRSISPLTSLTCCCRLQLQSWGNTSAADPHLAGRRILRGRLVSSISGTSSPPPEPSTMCPQFVPYSHPCPGAMALRPASSLARAWSDTRGAA